MPPAAPATSSVLRSVLESRKSCAIIDPKAPPVMMIGPFGAERAARTDRNGARKRLQDRDLRLHLAAVDQDRFDRFRNAVAADPLRPVARHQPDDQRARPPAPHLPQPQVVGRRRYHRRAPALEEEQIGEQPDQLAAGPAATYALTKPIPIARHEIDRTRGVIVKSPSFADPAAWTG